MKKPVIKQVRISRLKDETLKKLKYKYGIDVSQFIRLAIAEKIKRDYKIITEVKEKDYCPF
jgi:hypothetical protein